MLGTVRVPQVNLRMDQKTNVATLEEQWNYTDWLIAAV